MPTPAIQTLINDAQQVLNLDSISAVRSVVAVSLANANTGTPLNPNLTTQQLWNEFYQVVTRSKSDIESIIANQLMKFLYSPPAPGGVGADKQVIFNDGGVLAGDAGMTYDKATDSLTVIGNIGVGLVPISGNGKFQVQGGIAYDSQFDIIAQFSDVTTSAAKGVLLGYNNTTNNGIIAAAYGGGTEGLTFWTHNGSSWGQRMELSSVGNLSTFGSGNGANLNVTTDSQVCGLRLRQTQNVHPATRNWAIYTNGNAYGILEFGVGASQFSDTYNTVVTVDGAGNITPTGNLVPANGKGIDFSATADGPSLTSELLNDYEEGTFLPAIIGTTTAGAGTYANQIGRYTKIGRIVTAQIFVNWSAHTGTGDMRLSGLPFVSNPTAGVFAGAAIGWVNNITLNAGYILTGYVLENSVQINLQQTPTGGGGTLTVPIDTSGGIILTVTYSV